MNTSDNIGNSTSNKSKLIQPTINKHVKNHQRKNSSNQVLNSEQNDGKDVEIEDLKQETNQSRK